MRHNAMEMLPALLATHKCGGAIIFSLTSAWASCWTKNRMPMLLNATTLMWRCCYYWMPAWSRQNEMIWCVVTRMSDIYYQRCKNSPPPPPPPNTRTHTKKTRTHIPIQLIYQTPKKDLIDLRNISVKSQKDWNKTSYSLRHNLKIRQKYKYIGIL